ncbi:hypothetical protein FSP39_016140 [Pinctada imbricata]|uniref:RING-type domain-containing protein n=1 Tax=Pinctada imbricata TaxID=66713 RepID=A0AA89CA17_PINIB|nr:hypothetical protein FSP39_016140 [Pinctada imbricata]
MAAAISAELTCPICLEMFEDPVTLACMHSYCRHCLESILKSSGGKILRCPECRLETAITNVDLQKMPRNFTLANIVAKYETEDKVPKIPCDLCDEKPPIHAVKSCKECKISYSGQCLFLHPKKGVLATHSLVEPQVNKHFVLIMHL